MHLSQIVLEYLDDDKWLFKKWSKILLNGKFCLFVWYPSNLGHTYSTQTYYTICNEDNPMFEYPI